MICQPRVALHIYLWLITLIFVVFHPSAVCSAHRSIFSQGINKQGVHILFYQVILLWNSSALICFQFVTECRVLDFHCISSILHWSHRIAFIMIANATSFSRALTNKGRWYHGGVAHGTVWFIKTDGVGYPGEKTEPRGWSWIHCCPWRNSDQYNLLDNQGQQVEDLLWDD